MQQTNSSSDKKAEPLSSSMTGSGPVEDAGSETLARYDYQISLTALDCLRALCDDSVTEIICEWWEDYVIVRTDRAELVSVKHREPSVGPWTMASIVDDGGLGHLFERWQASGGKTCCRLSTNAGLASGPSGAARIRAATKDEGVESCAQELLKRLPTEDIDEVYRFLACLEIEAELPKRDDLLPKLQVDVLPGLSAQLGWPPGEGAQRFDQLRREVHKAAASDIRSEVRSLDRSEDAIARALARKSLNRERISAAASQASGTRPSMLQRKLEAAKFGPTDIERSKRLRADWLALEYKWSTGLPGDQEPASIRRRVHDLASEAEDATSIEAEPYGKPMRSHLIGLLDDEDIEYGDQPLTTDDLLGAAYDETDRCHIWWSTRAAVTEASP